MTDALRFLALMELLGLAGLPLARVVLGRLPGAGAAFAKPLGLLVVTWLVFVGVSLEVVPLGPGAAVGAAVVVGLGSLVAWRGSRAAPPAPDRLAVALWLAGEVVFLAAFAGMALVVAHAPDVWGTEKPMDMAFLSSLGAADALPPRDPWLAGERLDYYYVGHLAISLVIEVAGVEPTRGYNLGLALVFALSASTAFALGAALWAAVRADGSRRGALAGGGLAVVLTVVLGNLAGVREGLSPGPGGGGEGGLPGFDWFAPSRVVPDTINEFPAFSFLLGDLHAHVLAVPLLLSCAAVALQLVLVGPGPRAPVVGLAAALLLGSLYVVNAWSFPLGLGLLGLALLGRARAERVAEQRPATGTGPTWAWAVGVLVGSGLLWLPFHLAYDPPTGGIGVVEHRRGLLAFAGDQLLLHGIFLGIGLVAWIARRPERRPGRGAVAALVAVLGLLAALAAVGLAGPGLLALGAAAATYAALRADTGARATATFLAGALACLLVPELVYVRDEFDGSALARMNTVFKLGYQAWVLLALACVGALAAAGRDARGPGRGRGRAAYALALAGLLALGAVYPVAGTWARTDGFAGPATLDGLGWLRATAPGDPGAIAWLRRHAPADAVVLETVGEDYSPAGHARIATFSGRATVLGWAGHERQWGHDTGTRAADVRRLYRTAEGEEAAALLRRYGVTHVVVGPLERADHGAAGVATWDGLGRRVYDAGGTVVWAVEAGRRT